MSLTSFNIGDSAVNLTGDTALELFCESSDWKLKQ